MSSEIFIMLIVCVIAFLLFKFYKITKVPKFGSFNLITGGVKSGKSLTTVWASVKIYKRRVLLWRVRSFFCRLLRRPLPEKPLYYSNVPIAGVDCVYLSDELIARQKRFAYGSVIYLQEASLFADSMSYKYLDNDSLLLLCKLIGHETRGGMLFVDTQSISDCHFAIKRCISTYYDIHHSADVLGLFKVVYLREMKASDDGSAVNVFSEDVEETLQRCIIPKKYFKYYDCFCYSALTDCLPAETSATNYTTKDSLKVLKIARAKPVKEKNKNEKS